MSFLSSRLEARRNLRLTLNQSAQHVAKSFPLLHPRTVVVSHKRVDEVEVPRMVRGGTVSKAMSEERMWKNHNFFYGRRVPSESMHNSASRGCCQCHWSRSMEESRLAVKKPLTLFGCIQNLKTTRSRNSFNTCRILFHWRYPTLLITAATG